MRIIVVGAGAVGSYLAERLSAEGQDVVVIEDDEERASQLQETIDAMVLVGNGASTHMLEEAGADKTDLLIAVSNSDGANILACHTATELGAKMTIARIEHPDLAEGADRLGVDVVIDPSATAAKELVGVVGAGGASELVEFANGRLIMIGGRVDRGAPITNGPLRELRMRAAEWGWVLAALVRDGRTIVAHGDTIVEPGDHALVMTTAERVNDATKMLGLKRHDIERTVIMGGTRLAELTADEMANAGLSVVVIDQDRSRCRYLANRHADALVVNGDPTDPEVVAELD